LYRRGTRLALGNALAGRLLQSAVDAGVTLWSDVRATKIFQDADGAVIGLEIERDGRLQTVRARRGVVLATGGFQIGRAHVRTPVTNADLECSLLLAKTN